MAVISDFRVIPHIDTFPRVVSFTQTTLGKTAVLASFSLGLRFFFPDLISVLFFTSLLALTTFFPEQRRFVLAVIPIALVIAQTLQQPLLLVLNLAVIASGLFLYWCAIRWPHTHFGRRPIAYLLGGFTALIFLACAASPRSLPYSSLWNLVGLVSSYIWFIGYALIDKTSKPQRDLALELGTFHPLWGSTNTPFPKGAAYLRRIEAHNPQQLAVAQLKGLKLLAWAILLSLLAGFWDRFFHGYLHIPTASQSLAMSVRRTPVAWHLRWASQFLAFFEIIMTVSIMGHRIIACCRLAGFNAMRNTYRPLSSTTLAEFFNRFYFYFKELLVDFFFYPTFFRYWKGHERLRLSFATFAAAFFGNSFYHLTRDWQIVRDQGLWHSIASYQVLFVYNAVLAIGLIVSQLRKRGPKPSNVFRRRVVPALGVIMFYCLLSVFETAERIYPLPEHLRYLASLFWLRF